jgi:hypothetical protein
MNTDKDFHCRCWPFKSVFICVHPWSKVLLKVRDSLGLDSELD